MSLLKLWNSLRGREATEKTTSVDPDTTPVVKAAPSKESHENGQSLMSEGSSRSASFPSKRSGLASSILSVGNRGPHGRLCKLVKQIAKTSDQPLRVLEIGVGDGSRAAAIIETMLKERANSIDQYLAVDTFEMEGGPIKLRDFNQLIRQLGVRTSLFPMPVEAGLMRIAHTLGSVDIVVAEANFWDNPFDVCKLISKVTRPESILLVKEGDTWIEADPTYQAASDRRAA